jgi:signal transduction histidine kinase/CheY-like chemotaxis protein
MAAEAAAPVPRAERDLPDEAEGERRLRVLLVEDDEDDYVLTRDLLAEIPGCGFELEWASGYDAALEALGPGRHDVYLFDYRLGRHDGLELLAEAVARGCKGPVILLTGQGEREVDLKAMKAGAADYLVKGQIDAALLERALRYAVERQRDQDALRQMHAALEDRVRERTAALQRANDKLRFLAEASTALAVLVDHESTLGKVARLAVPFFADWCVVHVAGEGGRMSQVAAHADPAQEELLVRLGEGFPPHRGARSPVARALKTGRPELLAEAAGPLAGAAESAEHRRLLEQLGPRSALLVPLTVRGEAVGVLAFFLGASGRSYGPDDLPLAEDLARRVAVALDNARLYKEVQDAARRKDEFLAMLAHELRNPLAPVRNALHIVRMRGNERRQGVRQAWEIVERQVEHMVRLVDDLLDVSRITRGKINLQKEPVAVATVVKRAVEGSRPLLEARGHTLEVAMPQDAGRVEGDPIRLAQVLWNLLNNAAKYTPEGGRVWLTVAKGHGDVTIRVRDTGMGIPPEVLPKVFDLFTQTERTLDRAEGGLGIGLTLVRQLTEMHDGRVEAFSEGPGRGSEFVVRLPLLPETGSVAPGGDDRPGAGLARAPAQRRILVVDDNRDSAESLATLLRLVGNDVRTAHDGAEALAVAAAYQPDLMLLDIGLPVLNGYEVARRLRTEPGYGRPVLVALTGYGSDEDRRRSLVAGFDHHLVKPVDFDTLQQLLASVAREEG